MQDLMLVREQLSRKDLFDAFARQLAKDFEQSNYPVDFIRHLPPDYNRIRDEIVLELERAEKRADSHLMQLLYRIDISETQLKRHLEESQKENHLMTIAELMIKRVLQKVVIRQYYKQNENG